MRAWNRRGAIAALAAVVMVAGLVSPAFAEEQAADTVKRADAYAGQVPIDRNAATALEWRAMPLIDIDGKARFQVLWAPTHLTIYVDVDDPANEDDSDGVSIWGWGNLWRDGIGDLKGGVFGRPGGYTMVIEAWFEDADRPVPALGDEIDFNLIVMDQSGEDVSWMPRGENGKLRLVEALSLAKVPQADAAPVVDGAVDAAWSSAPSVTTSKVVLGDAGAAAATVRTLWAGSKLFVLAEVADPVIDVSAADPSSQDSVEIFLDPGNAKNGPYRPEDSQIRVSAAGEVSFGTGDASFQQARTQAATALVGGGYRVEASIDLAAAGGPGTVHGLDVQVNDASGGQRTAIRTWADPTGTGAQSTARWGTAQLVAPEPPKSPVNLVRPKVTGTGQVGNTLTVDSGTWDRSDVTFAYQWRRNGDAIPGATGTTYRVVEADRGKVLTVAVTATAAGFPATVAQSNLLYGLWPSTTSLLLSRRSSTTAQPVIARVQIKGVGSSAGGTVQLTANGKPLGGLLAVESWGGVRVTLPSLPPGVYVIRAEFLGSPFAAPSKSGSALLLRAP
ncbi:sugar-binding protein [Microbacterium sp. SS28]|uniref:sugar-binding protein n=1 Tax=Microbacterium sp. SS28 TaxID=2919948 RepID=UPI001FAA9AE4|nr:sugar-binding protein [Microbacterium sp. SS28]